MTEFGFIDKICARFAELPLNGFEGIGDDCAVLPVADGDALLFTADLLNEGVHFLRRATSARELGGKALAVNLSDIAAMGGRPWPRCSRWPSRPMRARRGPRSSWRATVPCRSATAWLS